MGDLFASGVGIVFVIVVLLIVAVWIIFPFLVLARLAQQQRTLDEIAKHTKSQADFWRNRNVKIE